MREVTVSKEKLIDSLTKNLDAHRAAFRESHNAWQLEAIEFHNNRISDIKNGAIGTHGRDKLEPAEPASYEKNYIQALEMLKMEVGEVVTIGKDEFRQFVQDEWEFSSHFNSQVAAYTGKQRRNY